ncbi:hypothetical protein GUITHDRAFT_111069 [Guillardia theta CCMP2712]|uniref:Uncharacterized protein n=1 Tax=Guillardia theta (strain CCMP2712) TaxID=905079 RepID=L1J3W8_GUITC|nr:hypothetical protein GUITHDRAFT_111069 [Guillardia theta CCMP2712]EKX43027.1 hypothetical protein GUITHDRAFT_111069 [Guillardia theta CCMP2712]|eukprot:XP_005830007.1 hypothetical protein GUITHDRAFT_111069 [Guillardia theta CCMP2712]
MLAHSKGLVLFADGCDRATASSTRLHALDVIADKGVLGVMPSRLAACKGRLSELDGFESKGEKEVSLNERYGGLRDTLRLDCELLEKPPGAGLSSHKLGEQLVDKVRKALDGSADLLILHLDARAMDEGQNAELQTAQCLQTLAVVANNVWGDGNIDMLQCMMLAHRQDLGSFTFGSDGKEQNGHIHSLQDQLRSFLRPPQSSTMHNGRVLNEEEDGVEQRVIICTNHPEATRRDHVKAFDTEQICKLGGNGGFLAQHWLSETAFLLGKMPKYGA